MPHTVPTAPGLVDFFETFNRQTKILQARKLQFEPTSQGFSCGHSLPIHMRIFVIPGRVELSYGGRMHRQLFTYHTETQLKSVLLDILHSWPETSTAQHNWRIKEGVVSLN